MIVTWGIYLIFSTVASLIVVMGANKGGGGKNKPRTPQEGDSQEQRKEIDTWQEEEEIVLILNYAELVKNNVMQKNAAKSQRLADKINQECHKEDPVKY